MDYNQPLDSLHQVEEGIWVDEINMFRVNGRLCHWLTGFHPEKHSCHLDGGFLNGSYNVGQKVRFEDGATWLLRFPRVRNVCREYADEKVALEVEALSLIRERTRTPVPEVKAWGLADDNPLGLGPFILMTFIDGVCLNDLFTGGDSRLLKADVPDRDVEYIYRQMADFLLQIYEINFDRIGSLPTPVTGYPAPIRPLTWKTHEIMQTGGVNTFGDRTQGFAATSEYFQYLIGQDWEQLRRQPNSITGDLNAVSRYASLKILDSMIPQLVNAKYDGGPFKLICDDFGPANMIVRSKDDLTVVGVVDLEWVYAGPAQLFASAPWWLLHDRPVNEEWDFSDGKPPDATQRYFKCLGIFKRVLAEEEAKIQSQEVSELVNWSEASGGMWLHMLLSSGFFDLFSFPCMHLREKYGVGLWRRRVRDLEDTQEMKEFVAKKLRDLDQYDEVVDQVDRFKALVDGGKITREVFVATVSSVLGVDW